MSLNTPEQEKAAKAGWKKKQELIHGKADIKPNIPIKKIKKAVKGVSK